MGRKKYRNTTKAHLLMGELSGFSKQLKPNLVPEIKIQYNKGRRVLGNVKSSDDAAAFIRAQYKRGTIEAQETFNVIYLDNRNSILGYYQHSKGSLTSTLVDTRLIFAVALKSLSTGIILSHNHPSGKLKPSQSDIKVTRNIKWIGDLHNIEVLDHIIVTKDGHYSFADELIL
ncbi:MAG: JAB domain-containing protein [Bacteroidota bacterium]